MSSYPHLLSPVRLGGRAIKNRIMQLPTGTHFHEQGVGLKLIAFYTERAKGGIGSIVTGGMPVVPQEGYPSPAMRDDIPGFARLAHGVQAHGAAIIGQLVHAGRQHRRSAIPLLVAPSEIACPYSGGTPHELERAEIEDIVQAFVTCAVHLQEAGFDGVEVHAGQGHLIQQFLSPASNRREDEYGGSAENRMRFAVEVLSGIRQRCGLEFILGMRFGAEEFRPAALDIGEAGRIAGNLGSAGLVDYLSVTQGTFENIEAFTPDRHYPAAPFVGLAGEIKAAAKGIPVIACGRILDPERAERILVDGQADLIGLCRPLLADPEWLAKAAAGKADRIRRCVSCNQCWGWTDAGREIGCIHNAACGNELAWGAGTFRKAARAKRVVVVGGGPAGLETARVAAARGHRVTLHEAQDRLGGALTAVTRVPSYGELGWIISFLEGALHEAGVDVRLGETATLDSILSERPDAVVVATGAEPLAGLVADPGELPVYDYDDVLQRGADTGRVAVVLDEDGYYGPCAVTEAIARRGTKVYHATRFFEVGREIPATSRKTTLATLDDLGVQLLPTTWIEAVRGRSVIFRHALSKRCWKIDDVDCIVNVGSRRPRNALFKALKEGVAESYQIGDAYMPRRVADAIREGHRTGRAL